MTIIIIVLGNVIIVLLMRPDQLMKMKFAQNLRKKRG